MRHEKIQQTIIHTPNIHIMTLDLEYNGNYSLVVVKCGEYESYIKVYNCMKVRVDDVIFPETFWIKIILD